MPTKLSGIDSWNRSPLTKIKSPTVMAPAAMPSAAMIITAVRPTVKIAACEDGGRVNKGVEMNKSVSRCLYSIQQQILSTAKSNNYTWL